MRMQVLVGNTHNRPVLRNIFFFKLDLSNIIPASVPNAQLINSVAQSIGLHDFYQVGLWGFCEGFVSVGITYCSPPQSLYWFNPVSILLNELLAGATIALPTEVVEILNVLRVASQVMFGFFLTGLVFVFLLALASPLVVRSRWWSAAAAAAALLAALLVLAATVVASVISLLFQYAATAQQDLNLRADIGVQMFVCMWIATGFTLLAFTMHAGMGCCCVSTRDILTGRREIRGGVVQGR